MDFVPTNQSAQPPKAKKPVKKVLIMAIIFLALAGLAAVFIYKHQDIGNPLPANIKDRVGFKVIYPTPKSGQISSAGYDYQPDQKALTFILNTYGSRIVFTEQSAPATIGTGDQVYYQALGLHPYAQFQSKIAPVALTKFYEAGSLKPTGQTAVMAAKGTLLTAHPDKNLTNAQWKDLLDSFKISR